jgi:translocation and assembly module TamB
LLIAMQDSVSDLSGNLDGLVEVAFEPGSTRATGEIVLRDGLVLIPALGKQVHDIQLTVRAAPGKLELSQLDAKVERGAISGKGNLTYAPEGRFVAELNLRLPDDKRLPIANKGRDVAEASGRIDIKASAGPNDPLKVIVDVPELDVHFSDSATDTVMTSESPSFVTLGTYLADGHYVRYSGGEDPKTATDTAATKPTRIVVNLGKRVWLHHGKSTFAGIHGNIEADLGETTRVLGTLNLAEGRIDIQGRVFDIRPGTVTFRGDTPPNPDIVAEAAWASPSGHTVIAAYRGSITNGKVILRSEPPLSYGEILNVLLFDDPEGAGGSEGSPGAGDVAATVASAGLSKSLTSLTDLDIQASIDTDPAGSPRPELGVRLSPRLAVEVAYVLQPLSVLSQPPDRAFVTFDWRLSNAWTLETTLGDHGSAATDVTWKYRY